jgi:hypothetical protein
MVDLHREAATMPIFQWWWWTGIGTVVLAGAVSLLWRAQMDDWWRWYFDRADKLAPLATFIGASATIFVGIVAAWIALARHRAQTKADIQRRITESYSKATEQLGSDKIAVRLGGIYTLERVSRESPYDYWTVMETITAFVREQAHWRPALQTPPFSANLPPPTDIAAALAVVIRRPKEKRKHEKRKRWRIDLSETDLRQANLSGAHLERADLHGAHLEDAHLEGSNLSGAHLEKATLWGTRFERANLRGTHLEGANLRGEIFGAIIGEPPLVQGAKISQKQLNSARGNFDTLLPAGLRPPAHWDPPKFPEPDEPWEPGAY